MAIQVVKTPAIENQLRLILGQEADLSQVAVYEMVALGQKPLKTSGLYSNAVVSEQTMYKLVSLSEMRPVPIIELHAAYSTLPVGRVFKSGVRNGQLHALAYFTKQGQTDLIAKMDTGTIRDVSVGFTPSSLTCSACNYDFLASEDGRELLFEGYFSGSTKCGNDHTMGKDNVYLQIMDVSSWSETSLVTRGASEDARMLGKEFQVLANEDFTPIPLAASTKIDTLLQCNTNPPVTIEDNPMDATILRAEVELRCKAEAKADRAEVEAQLAQSKSELEAIKATHAAEIAAKETAIADKEAALAEAETAKVSLQTRIDVLLAGGGDKADPATKTSTPDAIDASLYTITR